MRWAKDSLHLFLSGPMGSGKSTVGPRVAEALGLSFRDVDAEIERQAGASVAEVFAREGEGGFRAREREVVAQFVAMPTPQVVALGGGAVVDRASRHSMLQAGVVVTLTASIDELLARTKGDGTRPLLAGGAPRAKLEALLAARADAYAECHATVDTSAASLDEVVTAVRATYERADVVVPLGQRTYRVSIGEGLLGEVPVRLRALSAKQILEVTDDNVVQCVDALGDRSVASHPLNDAEVRRVVLPAGEVHKTVETVAKVWDTGLDAGFDRGAVAVAVGGGVVGDMTGFAAATYMRGIRFVQVPTTVLAMVDSSVGGKTGVDRPQGKNLVGAFHQPEFVICALEVLRSLPEAERVAGLAEVLKSAWLAGEDAVAMMERDAEAVRAGDLGALARAVRMSVQLKAHIVSEDEREGGARRLLNLGHTVGHAIEAAFGYAGLRHGEAVALGMIAAFDVANALGGAVDGPRARLIALLKRLGLPHDLKGYVSAEALKFLKTDKKRAGDYTHFVVPGVPGDTRVVKVQDALISEALAYVLAG